MTDLEMQAMEKLASERDVARELCRDALAARDAAEVESKKALACEQAALGQLHHLVVELQAAQAKGAAVTAEHAQERGDGQEVVR